MTKKLAQIVLTRDGGKIFRVTLFNGKGCIGNKFLNKEGVENFVKKNLPSLKKVKEL